MADTNVNESTSASEEASAPNQASDAASLVPVSEAIRYRKRAQAAEQQLHDTQQQLQTLRSDLAEAQASIDRLERRQRLDALLADAGVVDLDAARTLAEHALKASSDDAGVDPAAAVDELRRRKPYLFRSPAGAGRDSGVMAPRLEETAPIEDAAQRAAETGDRRDLLAYLRLRRRSS